MNGCAKPWLLPLFLVGLASCSPGIQELPIYYARSTREAPVTGAPVAPKEEPPSVARPPAVEVAPLPPLTTASAPPPVKETPAPPPAMLPRPEMNSPASKLRRPSLPGRLGVKPPASPAKALPSAAAEPSPSAPVAEAAVAESPVEKVATPIAPPESPVPTVTAAAKTEPPPAPAASPSANRFYVEVGQYPSQEQVHSSSQRLEDLGFPVVKKPLRKGERTLVQILAGPFQDESAAKRAAALLSRQEGLKGQVVYGPP
ncbi:MAG: SPOR domain-containing protein [Magnetococcales bacterium]|nr:SPOR domain-containing protein [Magnetococcales bacterium]